MSDINTGYSFVSGEQVTHTKLNNTVGAASINTSFLTDKGSVGANPNTSTTLVLAYDGSSFVKGSLSALFFDHTGLLTGRTAKTTPVSADVVMLGDSAASGAVKQMTVSNLLFGAAAHTAPVGNDKIPIYDSTGTAAKTVTLTSLVNGLTSKTTLASADTFPIYDSAGTTIKKAAVSTLAEIVLPPGLIAPYSAASAPTGWLICNGSAVSRTTYAALFAIIGTTWGSGDGSTTFNVPDLRGRAPIGSGTGSGLTARTLAATVGNETHTLAESEMPAHTHGTYQNPAVAGASSNALLLNGYVTSGQTYLQGESKGGGGAHNNMQPSLVVNFIIKT